MRPGYAKIAQTIGLGGSALFLFAAGSAATPLVAVLTMCGALACLGVCYSGFAPAALEMAPRHVDILWSISAIRSAPYRGSSAWR